MLVAVARGLGVGPDREAERFAFDAGGTEHASDLAGRPGSYDGESRLELLRGSGDRPVVARRASFDADDPVAFEDRERFRLEPDVGAGCGGGVDQRGVETTSRPHRTVVRKAVGVRNATTQMLSPSTLHSPIRWRSWSRKAVDTAVPFCHSSPLLDQKAKK
jgi:hypothetical protein